MSKDTPGKPSTGSNGGGSSSRQRARQQVGSRRKKKDGFRHEAYGEGRNYLSLGERAARLWHLRETPRKTTPTFPDPYTALLAGYAYRPAPDAAYACPKGCGPLRADGCRHVRLIRPAGPSQTVGVPTKDA